MNDKAQHPLKSKPNPERDPNFFNSRETRKQQKKSLKARRGWFVRFKERCCVSKIKVQNKAVMADVEPAESYQEHLAVITMKEPIFNGDEQPTTEWCHANFHNWRKVNVFRACLKVSKDRLTLLRGASKTGDFK